MSAKGDIAITKYAVGAVILWYVFFHTTVGQSLVSDMSTARTKISGAIPQQLGVAEGLKSAFKFVE